MALASENLQSEIFNLKSHQYHMVVIVMGVSGAGKTTVGTLLAATAGWRFVDGDLLHPPANTEKMRNGLALTEQDRVPWLAALHEIVARTVERRESVVIACSALKAHYRDLLRGDCPGVRFVYLKVAQGVAVERSAARVGHFAGPTLVPSQYATLEEPADALIVDGALPPEQIIAAIRDAFGI
jgi:gluconokinase